jgi:hypothetical protein
MKHCSGGHDLNGATRTRKPFRHFEGNMTPGKGIENSGTFQKHSAGRNILRLSRDDFDLPGGIYVNFDRKQTIIPRKTSLIPGLKPHGIQTPLHHLPP